jgi:hypothetical protein
VLSSERLLGGRVARKKRNDAAVFGRIAVTSGGNSRQALGAHVFNRPTLPLGFLLIEEEDAFGGDSTWQYDI